MGVVVGSPQKSPSPISEESAFANEATEINHNIQQNVDKNVVAVAEVHILDESKEQSIINTYSRSPQKDQVIRQKNREFYDHFRADYIIYGHFLIRLDMGFLPKFFLSAIQAAISELPAICRQKRQFFHYVIVSY